MALLDKVATSPRPAQSGVTFPQALFGMASKASGERHAKKGSLSVDHETIPRKPLALAKPAESHAPAVAPGAEDKPVPAKLAVKAEKKPTEGAVEGKSTESSPGKKPTAVKESKPVAIPTVAPAGDGKSKGHFALQLSSFQDKSEAETFAQKFQGERPYMVVSEIPGKGTWYRVRVGDYASAKDALAAKQSFEKKHNVIAYVAQK